MVIFKLIKANIKHKKGAFKSIAALMAIITLSFTVTVSNNDNIDRALTQAYSQTETPDMTAFMTAALTDREIAGEIKENPDVVDVTVTDCILSTSNLLNDQELYQVCYIYPGSHDIYRVFNENFTGYISEPAPLESGEIYIAYSLTGLYSDVKIGSELIFGNDDNLYKFRVKGFVSEPNFGAAVIGTKRFFISPGDFEKMYANADQQTFLTVFDMGIDLRDGADCIKVKKALDDSCGISGKSSLIISSEETESYTKLYSKTGTNMIDSICLILVIAVFSVSIIFSVVVINMICGKAFIKERTDIGILKAVGFTARELHAQFAFRFLIISAVGAIIGGICSLFFTRPLLEMLLRMVGLTRIESDITFVTFIIPALLICLCFFLFSYIAAGKTRTVEVRELISY